MSEQIKHECGIVLIRLRKPVSYYLEKYGTETYALEKLCLLMEKQHNRGQEAAGIAALSLGARPAEEYIFRERALGSDAIDRIFKNIYDQIEQAGNLPERAQKPYIGELYMGHLRYSTTHRSGISHTHPFLRRNNWRSRNLCLAGNFNLTNVPEILAHLVSQGQHPRHNADTFIMLEQLGCLLDEQVEKFYELYTAQGYAGESLNSQIERSLDMAALLREASVLWDGGFVITGITGSGDAFVFRDRWGIRTAHWYADDEIVVAASERSVIQTVLNVPQDTVHEIEPGQALLIDPDGTFGLAQIDLPENPRPCSFERIYFSRGSDADIYSERKELGRLLTDRILRAVDYDTDHTVFSFIPNTAEVAFYGMVEGLNDWLDGQKADKIAALAQPTAEEVAKILSHRIRTEKIAIKDIKLRTFISEGTIRDTMAAHVYDITYGKVVPQQDTIVVIDDSIVRGTTLRQSIVRMLARLQPRKIVVVSSSPQVRYPDCYGIDMSSMSEFIAFNAAVELLEESGRGQVLHDVYIKCQSERNAMGGQVENHVKEIYAPFSDEEISARIARMVRPQECVCEVEVVYQSIANLHTACPRHSGDWYFSGNYPTPGGNRVVNNAFITYYESQY